MTLFVCNNTFFVTALLGVIILITLLAFFSRKKYHGPQGLPYFGIFWSLRQDFHLQLMEMARKKYGDVFVLKVTGKNYVHLGSLESIREVHVKKAEHFSHRIRNNCMLEIALGKGLFLQEGEDYKASRKFFINVFRELAGKEGLAGRIDIARSETIKRLRNSKGKPVRILPVIEEPYLEAVAGIFFGDSNKHLVHDILNAYARVIKGFMGRNFLLSGSLARWFVLRFTYFKEMNAARKEMESIFHKIIRQREEAISSGESENTVVDRYLQERNSLRKKGDPKAKAFEVHLLAATFNQMFGDACEGVAAFMLTLLSELSVKPDVQKKMREEMIHELGDNLEVNPTLDDKVRLPYTNAVLKELFRNAPFIFVLPTMESSCETTICGVKVPAGCGVFVNFWAAHHDPKVFDEPDKFKPERFLSLNSSSKIDQPASFGMGKRSCVGEFMSTMVIYLYSTAIIRNFELLPTEVDWSTASFDEALNMEMCAVPVNSQKSTENSH